MAAFSSVSAKLTSMPAFFICINDPLGGNPMGTAFTPVIFKLFDAWANHQGFNGQRASIARAFSAASRPTAAASIVPRSTPARSA